MAEVLDTRRPRAGKRFAPIEEALLEGDAVAAISTLPNAHRGLTVVREASGPFGVPDLLALVGSHEALRARSQLAVPPLLSEVDAGVVSAAAARAPRTVETLARRLSWPTETVERRIPQLTRNGALLQVGPRTYVRPADLRPVGRLFAVETKIRDWRRALRQARTYATWCDGYIIVMASLSGTSLKQVASEVASDGGGLMVDGHWLQRPRIQRRSAAQRMWGSEHLVDALTANES